jgi:uncharacterized protein (TIGR02452 family)
MSGSGGDKFAQTKLSSYFQRVPDTASESIEQGKLPSTANHKLGEPIEESRKEEIKPQKKRNLITVDQNFSPERSPAELRRRKMLSKTAQETKTLLPGILKTVPQAPPKGHLYSPPNPPILNHNYCPGYLPAEIKVLNADTFDTAINVATCGKYMAVRDKKPVCVLNMANAQIAGGGWLNGAVAQEEALCYRSSLSFTLKLRFYPLQTEDAIYSPTVVIIRESMDKGHGLLDFSKPEKLPIVSAISVAALREPQLDTSGPHPRYKHAQDKALMKEKIRIILRIAAYNGHRRLVLGALGCGAFKNPRREVANCWHEVFSEKEFRGGWWESICFAVMDDLKQGKDGNGNYGIFYRKLHNFRV